jgi:hypothetical protein
MRLSRKGSVYEKAPPDDRVLRAHGLPTRYWDVTVEEGLRLADQVRTIGIPRAWRNTVHQVTAVRQRKLIARLLTEADALRRSQVIGVGSSPTDELGMALAAALVRRTRDLKLRPLCISMRRSPSDEVTGEPDVVILHNMTAECHAARAHACRDWLDRFDDTLRFVIVAGCDPYTFSHTRLFCPLDDFLYLEGELREDVQH